MAAFGKNLKNVESAWKKAHKMKDEGGYECPVDDGIYIFRVTGAELTESQNGNPMVHWEYTVVDGDSKGEIVHDYDVLRDDADSLVWLQRKISRLGLEVPESMVELEACLSEIAEEKPTIKGRVRTKDDFTHVYIQKLLDSAEETEDEDEDEEEESPKKDKKDKKGKSKKDEEEEEEEEESEEEEEEETEEEEEVDLSPGDSVVVTDDEGEEWEGTILKFVEDEDGDLSMAIVKDKKGKKHKVEVASLSKVEDETEEEEEEEEKPSAKVKKVSRKK